MKAIIIGSRGFIGHHIYESFQERGFDVWGADVVAHNRNGNQYFQVSEQNSDFDPIFTNNVFDLCINCSGAANVPGSLTDPYRDFSLNTLNVFLILDSIRKYQPGCRFINLSSAAVYGNPSSLPVKESSIPEPLSPYGNHKLQSEQICKEFNSIFNIQTCSLRIFSVYGVGLQRQIFWDVYNKARTNVPFTLFGTGDESRDFIYISDLVKAIEIVAESSSFQADIYNIANGEEVYIKDAVSIFFRFFDTEIAYSFSNKIRDGDPVNWKADISKLTSFGYRPTVDIETGLRKYYEWLKGLNFD